jgi:hypothetical protein
MAVQQSEYVNAAEYGTLVSGLIGLFVFDILQIASGCNLLATSLLSTLTLLSYTTIRSGNFTRFQPYVLLD